MSSYRTLFSTGTTALSAKGSVEFRDVELWFPELVEAGIFGRNPNLERFGGLRTLESVV
jgi:hypothetical protein